MSSKANSQKPKKTILHKLYVIIQCKRHTLRTVTIVHVPEAIYRRRKNNAQIEINANLKMKYQPHITEKEGPRPKPKWF